jgi:hypothetical protein
VWHTHAGEKQLIGASDKDLWAMLGSPFFSQSLFDTFRVTTDSGNCSDSDGCTLVEAGPDEENLLQSVLWAYDGTGYVSTGAETGGGFEWWTGYWARVIENANASNPTLLIPKQSAELAAHQ